ncbi:MAG: hypothetical protein N0E58_08605 [Candidatus Thiodiazotropha endolucinida]|uniref:Uncharacterized protein n=1 Tax=Candidatus Thiodiazotropha taylori TaxID=2792791 RepID=A0A9E4NJ19_9GAMM|nr:hypothetical protein [Candidatus Thiodiazotropha taylori]MCG7978183.1 hypothetical protein [Candidatus Thiodiazotropha taylori]MCW4236313.1 hypothetical protein [Candidatus Thiodiazotropha endolucinida]
MLKGLKSFITLLLMTAASTTFAVHINYDRTGQVALLPYYTVNNNFITNFTVTNTTSYFKAVRVRLLDSRIGADLLNINLYLSPFDVWNATLRMNPDTGLPNLITEDESCTYPAKAGLQAGIDFENPYTATTDDDLTEGYVEIIEMGDVADGAGPVFDGGFEAEIDAGGAADGAINIAAGDRSIPMGLLHDANGIPADCSVVADAWTAGAASASNINGFEPGSMGANGVAQESGDPARPYDYSNNAGLVAPSGGVNAYGIMINMATGAAFVQEGVHIDRYTTVAQHYLTDDPVHYRLPSLASGDIREAYITNALGDGKKGDTLPLTEYDTGALHDISPLPSVPMGSNPLPIALTLSAETVSVPYFVEENVNGETDVILTFPMRKHGIYNGGILTNQLDPNETACVGELDDGIDDGQEVNLASLGAVVQDYPHNGAGEICTNVGFELNLNSEGGVFSSFIYYDYEVGTAVMCFEGCISPAPPPTFHFLMNRSVNVNRIVPDTGNTTPLFGTPSANAFVLILDPGFVSGWMTFAINSNPFIYNSIEYNYENNPSMQAMTEPVGGLGTSVNNSWTGVPVIGFSAMAADVGPAQLGETVELIRETNRD